MMFILSNHVVILISYYIWLTLKFQINLIIKLYKIKDAMVIGKSGAFQKGER